ncbi:MAG: hypothetical protein ACFFBR_01290 [Promethearchaeota archaeon]
MSPTNSIHQTWTSIHDWAMLRDTLAATPEARQLLNTYGTRAWKTLEHDLARHPYLQTRTTCTHSSINALWHRILTAARHDGHLSNKTYKDLQDLTGIPAGRLRDWHLGIKQPHLERTLTIHEAARHRWERHLPTETQPHLLDPSLVYTTFQHLLDDPTTHTPAPLTTALATLYHHKSDQRLLIAELKPYHKRGPQQLRTIAHSIQKHRSELERKLTERLQLANTHEELRLAIDHDVLYLWRKTTLPDHWLNTYHHELLYLTPHIKEQLLTTAQHHLNTNTQQLGQLLNQLTTHPRHRTYNPRAAPYELWSTKYNHYLHGDTLHLLLNTTNQPFNTITPHITHIGRISTTEHSGGIHNPRFPEGKELNELRARLIAIALSDCHINKTTHVLTYHEKDPKRIEYVRTLFRQLGETDYKTEELQGQRKRLTITAVVGRLLEHWGVPKGDKLLSPDFRLPQTIKQGTLEMRSAYLAEVVPEDGFFVERNGQMKFGIKRAHVLDAGPKTKLYRYKPMITHRHNQFIQKYGIERYEAIRDDKPRKRMEILKGRLDKLTSQAMTQKDEQIARELRRIIKNHPCELLEDEKNLIKSLGIQMTTIFKKIILHETNRVSAIWEIYTKSENDTYCWAIITPPSSGEKRKAALEWIKDYQKQKSLKSIDRKGKAKIGMERLL